MAEIERFWNGHEWQVKTITGSMVGSDARCLVCGDPATAFWNGPSGQLTICRTCAVEKLPLVVADAIAGDCRANNLTTRMFDDALPRLERAFWRGAAIALGRRSQPGFNKDDGFPTAEEEQQSNIPSAV